LSRVAEITGISPELIAKAARIYATSPPAVIPRTPITDQQRNSTSAIRLMSALRAICGNLDVKGGELFHGFHPDIISESALEMHEILPEAQRAKQLGADAHPAFTYRAADKLREHAERVWGIAYPNIVHGTCMAVPSAVFRAMADGDLYCAGRCLVRTQRHQRQFWLDGALPNEPTGCFPTSRVPIGL
jgi:anaerobic selenocysteine-containing dehydrogenase